MYLADIDWREVFKYRLSQISDLTIFEYLPVLNLPPLNWDQIYQIDDGWLFFSDTDFGKINLDGSTEFFQYQKELILQTANTKRVIFTNIIRTYIVEFDLQTKKFKSYPNWVKRSHLVGHYCYYLTPANELRYIYYTKSEISTYNELGKICSFTNLPSDDPLIFIRLIFYPYCILYDIHQVIVYDIRTGQRCYNRIGTYGGYKIVDNYMFYYSFTNNYLGDLKHDIEHDLGECGRVICLSYITEPILAIVNYTGAGSEFITHLPNFNPDFGNLKFNNDARCGLSLTFVNRKPVWTIVKFNN